MSVLKTDALEVASFKGVNEWSTWLARNYEASRGIWVKFFKKDSGVAALSYPEAVEEALCHGWIDGQAKKCDEGSWVQRFTPRRARSVWSKRNVEKAERLIKEGRMKPSGLKQIETAKADGRWAKAYEAPSTMSMPKDFLRELAKDEKAMEFFNTLNKANKYAIAWRLHDAAKPETRERRLRKFVEMMKRRERLH